MLHDLGPEFVSLLDVLGEQVEEDAFICGCLDDAVLEGIGRVALVGDILVRGDSALCPKAGGFDAVIGYACRCFLIGVLDLGGKWLSGTKETDFTDVSADLGSRF